MSVGSPDDAHHERLTMRRTVGCTRLPNLRPASVASARDGDKTQSIAGQRRPLPNHFELYIIFYALVSRSGVRLPGMLLSCNNSGQVVHTHVTLSSSSIMRYWPKVGDALRLGS